MPALPAIAAAGSSHEPVTAISWMMTANAAFSAWVKPAAMLGGIQDPAAHDRRRAMLADDRGREPKGLRGVVPGNETPFFASINSARRWASSSDTAPAAKPFQTAADNSGSRPRWQACTARLISSANISALPLVGAVSAQSDLDRGNANFRVDSLAGGYETFAIELRRKPLSISKSLEAPTSGLFSFYVFSRPASSSHLRASAESRD